MEPKKTARRAEHHPAIQNLRKQWRLYSLDGKSLNDFARYMNMSYNELGRYLRGDCTPRKAKIEDWANQLYMSFEEMMAIDTSYCPYPLNIMQSRKKSGRHLTKKEVHIKYEEGLMKDYALLVSEGIVKYEPRVIELFKKRYY